MPRTFFGDLLSDKNHWRTLTAVSVVALIVQLLTLRNDVVIGEPYVIAKYLRYGMGFIYIFPWDTMPSPTCFIPPGYAYFLYGLMALGGGMFILQLAGLLFFNASNFFLYAFFSRYIKRSVAAIGFVAYSFFVPLWLLAEKVDPDGLNILLVVSTVFLLDSIRREPTMKRWVLLGVLYGIQILVRPDILMGIVFFGIWLYVIMTDKKAFLKGYSIAIVLSLVIVSPWTIRNYNEFGRFVLVSSNSGYNLFLGNNPSASGEFQQADPTPESIAVDSARAEYFRVHRSGVERDSYLFHVAMSWAIAHPLEVAKLAIKKFYYHWWLRESAGVYIHVPVWMIVAYNIGSLLLVIFGAIGLFAIGKGPRSLLLVLFAYSTAIAMIFFVQTRHRALKVDPFLITLSFAAIGLLYSKVRPANANERPL